jgi:hypothetical protein
MPKTVSIAPSWYWPSQTPRFCGIPPFGIDKLIVGRLARERPDHVVLKGADISLTGSELDERIFGLRTLVSTESSGEGPLRLSGAPSAGLVELFLAGAASGNWIEMGEGRGAASLEVSAEKRIDASAAAATESPRDAGPVTNPERPVLGWAGVEVVHSHSSLVAAAISLSLFYSSLDSAPWIVALSPSSWAWPAAVLGGLYRMVPVILEEPGGMPAIADGPAPVILGELHALGELTREAKRELKAARGRVAAVIAVIDGPFDPGERKRLEKLLDCPVLTLLGRHDAGPVIASHPDWYVAESAGIPITNADVMPVDPRSKEPIQTLWELVEYAQITVRSPMVAPYRRDGDRLVRNIANLADLELLGSSDPNGMIYILPS